MFCDPVFCCVLSCCVMLCSFFVLFCFLMEGACIESSSLPMRAIVGDFRLCRIATFLDLYRLSCSVLCCVVQCRVVLCCVVLCCVVLCCVVLCCVVLCCVVSCCALLVPRPHLNSGAPRPFHGFSFHLNVKLEPFCVFLFLLLILSIAVE